MFFKRANEIDKLHDKVNHLGDVMYSQRDQLQKRIDCLENMLRCGHLDGHDFAYVGREFGDCFRLLYPFRCKKCGFTISKEYSQLTVDELAALKELGIVEGE